jgi:hypothetical protein
MYEQFQQQRQAAGEASAFEYLPRNKTASPQEARRCLGVVSFEKASTRRGQLTFRPYGDFDATRLADEPDISRPVKDSVNHFQYDSLHHAAAGGERERETERCAALVKCETTLPLFPLYPYLTLE